MGRCCASIHATNPRSAASRLEGKGAAANDRALIGAPNACSRCSQKHTGSASASVQASHAAAIPSDRVRSFKNCVLPLPGNPYTSISGACSRKLAYKRGRGITTQGMCGSPMKHEHSRPFFAILWHQAERRKEVRQKETHLMAGGQAVHRAWPIQRRVQIGRALCLV